ncbi:thymidine kinase [Mesomycoplasma lagogenitalium]|uniref:Thymidine kinase n=1 Tax=Mesomycoplasma lagogenitalium TaxID=171286 RepID=A0ABY8LU71_9BACT|nr:thymidine kinase [Mesomycoplasma lagogenitalium]WGI36788.1 thymidine kinase [Mesomycoplasma lagogenitalium]
MYKKFSEGMIEVITGPMFSGKSEELLKRIRILEYANIKTLVIKPNFDTRFSENEIISRSGAKISTHSVSSADEIRELFKKKNYKAVAIDEVHFFNKDVLTLINELADDGIRVIVSGLDLDYLRRPFGIMPYLLSMAETITKLQAVCVRCKNAASTSFRKVNSRNLKMLGDIEEYEARCRSCHIKGEFTKMQEVTKMEEAKKNVD